MLEKILRSERLWLYSAIVLNVFLVLTLRQYAIFFPHFAIDSVILFTTGRDFNFGSFLNKNHDSPFRIFTILFWAIYLTWVFSVKKISRPVLYLVSSLWSLLFLSALIAYLYEWVF